MKDLMKLEKKVKIEKNDELKLNRISSSTQVNGYSEDKIELKKSKSEESSKIENINGN